MTPLRAVWVKHQGRADDGDQRERQSDDPSPTRQETRVRTDGAITGVPSEHEQATRGGRRRWPAMVVDVLSMTMMKANEMWISSGRREGSAEEQRVEHEQDSASGCSQGPSGEIGPNTAR